LHLTVFIFGESSTHAAIALCLSGLFMFVVVAVAAQVFPLIRINRIRLKEIFFYAFPLMIYALGGIGYSHGYRVIISTWLRYDDLAMFTLASQISMVYYLAASSSITGFAPRAYKALEEQQGDPRAIRFYFKILLAIGLGMGVLVVPASYMFLLFFKGGAFYNSTLILPMLLLGQFFFLLYNYNYILSTFYKETNILTYSMVAGVSVSLILAVILVEKENLWGAAIPVTCGLFIQFVTSLILVRRVVKKRGIRARL
jgi:O-antigen/teichoic acid export membrane protein